MSEHGPSHGHGGEHKATPKVEKPKREKYKSGSEIFIAIKNGNLLIADILSAEEKQMMIDTLAQKYDAAYSTTNKQPAEKKSDPKQVYEYYLSLANSIGFDGTMEIKPKPASTYNKIITGQKITRTEEEIKRLKPEPKKPKDDHGHHGGHH